MATFTVNGQRTTVDVDPSTPILWAVRDTLGLTGTKFGCGMAQCGACTVHLNGQPIRSCVTPVSAAEGAAITTIEGAASDRVGQAAPRTNMTCATYPREISEQRGRYDDQPAIEGPDARSQGFIRSGRIARSP